jgi:hypothetical protein
MVLPDLIRVKSFAHGYETPAQLHKALIDAGAELTYEAVYQWWTGKARPERHATALVELLEFTDKERLLLYELPLAA